MMSGEPLALTAEVTASPVALASARSELAALDDLVLGTAPKVSLGRHLFDIRAAVAGILGDPTLAPARGSGDRQWSLALIAEEGSFGRHYDAVAMAIADLFTLKVHLNLDGLHTGFA